MDDSFEAHMTFSSDYASVVQQVGERGGWSFSQIDGDPILGAGHKCYLTKHLDNGPKLLIEMNNLANAFTFSGIPHIRLKVERIMYDTKTGVDRLSEDI